MPSSTNIRILSGISNDSISEQGVTFAVVIVKKHVIDSRTTANEPINDFWSVFPGMPVVLMAQDRSGRPTYYGRPDLSQFMARVSLHAIP